MLYAVDELDEAFCPWCIANGTAAEKFEAEFTDVGFGVPADGRDPGFDAHGDTGAVGHRWGHSTRIGDLCGMPVPHNHAVSAERCGALWAVKDSNLRPWD